jgi:hypothetical protein
MGNEVRICREQEASIRKGVPQPGKEVNCTERNRSKINWLFY